MQNRELEIDDLYPLLFTPIYKEVMWGGNMLSKVLNRKLPDTKTPIGEAWEITDRPEAQSTIENGLLKGKTLNQVINEYGSYIIGEKISGQKKFPLLVKIIDAGKRLSLQVHPDENFAKKCEDAEPKNEMWYIIAAEKDAKIFAGINHKTTRRMFIDSCQTSSIEDCLQAHNSIPGDAYMINAGLVHAIGKGNLILEIQQNSDTTYRISDWGRVDTDGKPRALHLEKAIGAINFGYKSSPKISGVSSTAYHNRKFPLIKSSPYFKIDDLRLVETWNDAALKDSFQILSVINNPVKITNDKITIEVEAGRSCLIPAYFGKYSIIVEESKETTIVKTYL